MKRSIKRWNLKKIFVIAGVAAIVAGLAGCGGTKKDADKTTEINVGYFNNVTHAQALYMKAQGTLDKAFDGKARNDGTKTAYHIGFLRKLHCRFTDLYLFIRVRD